jgi:indole-3-acetate monooxygenase
MQGAVTHSADSHTRRGSAGGVLNAARALVPQVRACADEIERQRRLPAQLVAAFAQAGVFHMCVPQGLGGVESDPATIIETLATIAQADGSAGWCAMIGATSGVISAYLQDGVAREIYGRSAEAVTGGVLAPLGTAVIVDGGYRLTGRWAFASGCEHCAWLMGGSVILQNGTPRLLRNGQPESRLLLFPAADAQVIDTWTVSGLRGTGSHDIAVNDLFVPEARSVSLATDQPRYFAPLYSFPVFGLLALGIAGVGLGIARSAVDELTVIAGVKTPSGSRKRLGERALIQMHVAQAEALLRSARAWLFEAVGQAWEAAQRNAEMSLQHRATLRLAATHATASAARVVDLMYSAGGGTSVYATCPLQRQFRDIHVATQHMMVGEPTYELTGRVFLGIDTDVSQL